MSRPIRLKAIASVLIILVVCTAAHAQIPNPPQARCAALTPSLDVLYVGIPNRLTLSTYNYVLKDFDIKAENARVNYSMGSCTIMPLKAGQVTISVEYRENGKRTTIEQITVPAVNAPPAIFSLGPRKNEFSTAELLRLSELKVVSPIYQYFIPLELKSFTATIVDRSGKVSRYDCAGKKFSSSLRTAIAQLKSGDLITFTNILAIHGDTGAFIAVDNKTIQIS